jgi:enoyl-CoA hydratase
MADVLVAREGAVLTLTINRERQRNSLATETISQLLAALREADADADVRVVVLTGIGEKSFCSGGDLTSLPADGGFLSMHEGRRQYAFLLQALAGFEKPTIARVNGHALAGGLGLAVACDLALAADDVQFGTPEVNVGLFPYMVTALLFRAIPQKRAMELVLTGQRVSAAEAASWNLINRAVPRAELDVQVQQLATTLAAKSPAVLRLGKRALHRTRDLPLEPALELLVSQLSINSLTEDAMEGVASFIEKRPPEWKGR